MAGDPYCGKVDMRIIMNHQAPPGAEASQTMPEPRPAHRTAFVLCLLVVASYKPASIWAANVVGVPHSERLILVAAVVWLVALVAWFVSVRVGGRESTALVGTFVGLFFMVNAGPVAANRRQPLRG
jgi:hypothetical protein